MYHYLPSIFFFFLNNLQVYGHQIAENVIWKPWTWQHQPPLFRLYTGFQNLVNRICTWTHKWRGCIAFGLSHGWWRGSVANLTGVAISTSPESWCFRFLSDTPPSLMCASCLLTTWTTTCFKTYQKLPLNIANSVKKAALSTLQCYQETQHIKLY